MKHALAVLVVGLVCAEIVACQTVRVPDRISVTSSSLKVAASDPEYASCQSFALTRDDVSMYFHIAAEVGGPEFHDRAVILPCRYEGRLTLDGKAWHFNINAGGAGYLYQSDGSRRRYLCEQRCQKVLARAFGAD